MNVGEILDVVKESATRLKADGKEVLGHIKDMKDDLVALEADLAKDPTPQVRALIQREIESIKTDRPKHILALVEAQVGVEVAKLFEEGLTVALNIAVKVLLKM